MATSTPSEPETLVIFRRFNLREGYDVIALFPLIPESKVGQCSSYQRIGQHGAADYFGIISRTRPATLKERDTQQLKSELESVGYRLRVINRLPSWRRIQASRLDAGLKV